VLDARLTTLLCKRITVAKSKEMKTGCNLAESSNEGRFANDDEISARTQIMLSLVGQAIRQHMQVISFFPFNGGVRAGEKFVSLDKVQPASIECVNSIYTLVRQITYKIRSARPGGGGDSSPPVSWEYSSPVFY
jgi:hypothetical protein